MQLVTPMLLLLVTTSTLLASDLEENRAIQIIDDFNPRLITREHGEFAGTMLSFANKYRLQIVDEDPKLQESEFVRTIERRPQTILVANFNHRGDLYLAEIPYNALVDASALVNSLAEHKNVPIFKLAHGSILLSFSEDVRLYPQNAKRFGDMLPRVVRDFVYSFNFVGGGKIGAKGEVVLEGYQPVRGTYVGGAKYPSSHNLSSTQTWNKREQQTARAAEKLGAKRSPAEYVQVDLEKIDRRAFITDLLHTAHDENRAATQYETLCRSCTTPIIRTVRASKNTGFNPCYGIRGLIGKFSPARIAWNLKAHKVFKKQGLAADHPSIQRTPPKNENYPVFSQ